MTAAPLSTPMAEADERLPAELFRHLRAAAGREERGESAIAGSVGLLRQAGLLSDDGARDPARTARALMRVGAANLSVGRLWEGHLNAVRLVRVHGTAALKRDLDRLIAGGAFLGVWGAEGPVPVTLAASAAHLEGSKRFTSGLGTVSHAVVTVGRASQTHLALIDVTDQSRANPAGWDMHGMRATASGSYEFSGLPAQGIRWIGGPDDYHREPHFVGGVWRIAALQAGAAIGLLDMAATELRAMCRMQAEAQQARLMSVLMRAWAGAALTERAAQAAGEDIAAEQAVALSIAARLTTEEIALDSIRAVEQSIGLRHFDTASETGRMARDLAVYLRQAARDAFLQRAARHALGQDGQAWGVFG